MDDSYANTAGLAGGGQGTIANVTATMTAFTPATAADSLTLPQAAPGLRYKIANTTASTSGNVYPFKGDKVNALSINAAFALAGVKSVELICTTAGQWWTFPRVAS